jgi:hypothetical protein
MLAYSTEQNGKNTRPVSNRRDGWYLHKMSTMSDLTLSCHERLHHMAHQACLIIRSKSHEANVPYTEGKMRRTDGRCFPNSLTCCEEALHVVILTKHQGQSLLSRECFCSDLIVSNPSACLPYPTYIP